jgi:hypothetical protein
MAVAPSHHTPAAARPRLDGGEHGVMLETQADKTIVYNQSI